MKQSQLKRKQTKPRPCKHCGELTTNSIPYCSPSHAYQAHEEKKVKAKAKLVKDVTKAFNAETRVRKEQLKTRRDYIKDLQVIFNRFIRARDDKQTCISCGSMPSQKRGGVFDAGHYRSVGANPELRFNEDNCHKQCVRCNRELSGNVANYRINLIKRIGQDRVDIIEGKHPPLKWSVMEIKHKIKNYKQKLKQLEQGVK